LQAQVLSGRSDLDADAAALMVGSLQQLFVDPTMLRAASSRIDPLHTYQAKTSD
jgi:hypothetical protein